MGVEEEWEAPVAKVMIQVIVKQHQHLLGVKVPAQEEAVTVQAHEEEYLGKRGLID